MSRFLAVVFGLRKQRILRLALTLSIPLLGAVAVSAGSYAAVPLTLVSGPSPFANCTVGGASNGSAVLYPNAEVEPFVAVNPTNAKNIVAAWQQDRWDDGGSRGLVTGVTHNGGKSWSRTWAHFSSCAGGTAANGGNYERASDPWVTFAPNGDAYQISLSVDENDFNNAILVSQSRDGGDTWSEPATLIRDTEAFNFNDKESITADSTDASGRLVYAVWDRTRLPSDRPNFSALHAFSFRSDIMFARTTDGGASWEPARAIYRPKALEYTIGNQIVVLPNGYLVDVFTNLKGNSANGIFIQVIRSVDKGVTWSAPITLDQVSGFGVADPDTGQPVRTADFIPDIAVDPQSGALYAVWQDGRFSGGAHDDIAFSQSADGGLTWSPAVKINQTTNNAAAFTASVDVAADGTVGLTHYDFRNNTPAAGASADCWLLHCHSGCTNALNWSETHVAGPFDMETAPIARGYFLGDYEGLTSAGNAFLPFFIQTNTGNTANRTDAFFTTVGP